MGLNIKLMDFMGKNYRCEDAILLREIIKNNLCDGVTLDFDGFNRITTTFLTCLFSDLIRNFDRDYIYTQITVKNLSNYSDYKRVVMGTTFA